MSAWTYVLTCTMRNFFKQLIKKPAALIGYAILILMIAFSSLSMFFSDANEANPNGKSFYLLLMLGVILLISLPSIYSSINKFSLNLKMSDVNFMMTGPLYPRSILIYGQVKQSGAAFIVSLFMIFQMPVLSGVVGLDGKGIALFLLSWLMFLLTNTPVCMAIFLLLLKFPKLKVIAKILFYIYCVSIAALLLYELIVLEPASVFDFVSNLHFYYIPIVGWFYTLFMGTVTGYTLTTCICLAAIILTLIVSIWVIVRFASTDYYEDAITLSEFMETIKERQKKGKTTWEDIYGKKKKVKKVSFQFTGERSKAILQKFFLEQKKRGNLIINVKTIIITILCILTGYAVPAEEQHSSIQLLIVLGAYAYILFLTNTTSKVCRELEKPFIYLIPESNVKKLLAMTSWYGIKSFIDIFIGIMFLCFSQKLPIIDGILTSLIVFWLSMLFSFSDLTSMMLFGKMTSAGLKVYLKMLLNSIAMLPSAVVIIVLLALGKPITLGLIFMNIVSFLVALILMIPAAVSIKNPDYIS